MAILIAFPILSILATLQSAVISRMPLLHGTADLVLLALLAWAVQERVKTAWQWTIIGGFLVGLASALPLAVTMLGYLLATLVTLVLKRRVWHLPLLAMLASTFLGTAIFHAITVLTLRLSGANLPWLDALNLVTLPSILLNLLLAVPLYGLIGDLANWLYPEEIEM